MSKALGGVVTGVRQAKSAGVKSASLDNDIARDWFGEMVAFEAFHWHGESVTVPKGAALLLSSPAAKIRRLQWAWHLALQCHVEMTEEMVKAWCKAGAEEIDGQPCDRRCNRQRQYRRAWPNE